MNRVLFAVNSVLRWAKSWRRVVAVALIATLVVSMVFPSTVHAQFGLLGGIQNIINIINGAIRSALNAIGAVSRAIEALHQEIVWPVQLINQARNTIASLIAQFRGLLQAIYAAPIMSATLPVPASLEVIIRNHQTNDFVNLTQSYYRTFGA